MFIKLEKVSFTYLPGTPLALKALEGVDLEIERGESIGIVGRTGCGKSTLVQHFNALLIPQSGKVLVDGVDTSEKGAPRQEIRRKVGLVFQYPEDQFFEETVFKEVAFAPRNLGVEGKTLEDRVRWSLEAVGLNFEAVKDKSPFELSGGQMRRVAIASILSMEPEALVLDEPTAGLDPEGKRIILNQLVKLQKERGLTLIIVSHSMEDLARVAKRIVIMDKGKIKFDDDIRQVFSKVEWIESLGIFPPVTAQVAWLLREKGFDVSLGVLTPQELAEEIQLKILERKKANVG
ncbi:MAG: energy-coupling factor transport system ATP-binding protein [Candidatus Atribacteria bacterium]|nr:energy-coupling factor transport system ATP-binding protein [Candidatus Atribacteria bacterium]